MANTQKPMSTGEKIAAGGLGLALFGGVMAALAGGSKKPAPKLGGGPRKGCGPCGR